MKGITTIASLPGSGSGCQSALPAEVSETFRKISEVTNAHLFTAEAALDAFAEVDLLDAAGGGE